MGSLLSWLKLSIRGRGALVRFSSTRKYRTNSPRPRQHVAGFSKADRFEERPISPGPYCCATECKCGIWRLAQKPHRLESGQQSLCRLGKVNFFESPCHARKLTPAIELDHAANGTIFLEPLSFGGRIAQKFFASASGVPLW